MSKMKFGEDANKKLICNALLVGLNNNEIFKECVEKTGVILQAKDVFNIAEKIEKRHIMLKKLGEVSSQKLAQSAMQQGASEMAVNAVHVKGGKPGKKDCGYCTKSIHLGKRTPSQRLCLPYVPEKRALGCQMQESTGCRSPDPQPKTEED